VTESYRLCTQEVFVHNSSGASRSIDDILVPGGKPIGVKGSGPRASTKLREAIPVEKIKFVH